MRANLFFFFCAGFVGAVWICSLWTIPLWIFVIVCAIACTVTALFWHEMRWYGIAASAGCVAAIVRIAFMPDTFEVSMPLFVTFGTWVRVLSERFGSVFGMLYPEPIASFARGILAGSAGMRLDPGFMQALRTTSTLHLIAVSGYNVTLVASYAYRVLHWATVPRKLIWIFVLILLAIFTVFVGAPSSAVRASIMASLAVVAERFYRSGYSRNALAFAAAAMILWQPSVILDLGFELSFLATCGIMVLVPLFVGRRQERTTERAAWKQVIVETLCAQALVMPVLVLKSGTLSILGLAANFVVLPLIPVAMAVSFAAGVGFLLWHALGAIIAFVSVPFFLFMVRVITWFGSLPFAAVQIPGISAIWIAAYYAAIGLFVFRATKNNHIHA